MFNYNYPMSTPSYSLSDIAAASGNGYRNNDGGMWGDGAWEDYDYDEHEYEMPTSEKSHETPDSREGRSGIHRKMYIEAKELHKDKSVQIKELDKYLQELSSDIVEMIEDASNDERSYMEKKIQALASKIGSMNG